jgi:CBS domain-containing protein
MSVTDVMTRDVTTLNHNASLEFAEGLMLMREIRHIPIVDEEGAVVGMISNRDLFRSALAFAIGYGEKGRSTLQKSVKVKDVMVEPVITIPPGTTLAQAARLLVEHKVGCLPVVEDGRLRGIVTETDLLQQLFVTLDPVLS